MTDAKGTPILVVDDRPDNLLAVEAVLEPLAVHVIRANSGKEALRHLLTEDVAVILLDVQMPELDGYETARLIKARARTQNIPIIFLTARDKAVEHELDAYDTGAVDYLSKPFAPEVLRTKVQVFVDLYLQARTIDEQRALLERRLLERDEAETALRRQTVELERSNAELERFAFVASHDLREPLQVTAGFLDLLRQRHANAGAGDDASMLVDRAVAGIEGMARLVDDLLSYARASTGAQRQTEIALDDLLLEVRGELAGLLERRDAVVSNDPLPTVLGDRWQLGRLFAHLIDNAVRFHRKGIAPEVHVGVTRREDHWVISVRDNGRGVDPADIPRMFALLGRVQADPAEGGGTGVGLALCRRVVDRHGGDIWMESVVGQGSTVSFTLPVQVAGEVLAP
ncbi:MAG TPA: ATP-binding protein [Acidimicrobiales bacterium]|nr:ATP-binding protein [Acidimicrobiales bacterium]